MQWTYVLIMLICLKKNNKKIPTFSSKRIIKLVYPTILRLKPNPKKLCETLLFLKFFKFAFVCVYMYMYIAYFLLLLSNSLIAKKNLRSIAARVVLDERRTADSFFFVWNKVEVNTCLGQHVNGASIKLYISI